MLQRWKVFFYIIFQKFYSFVFHICVYACMLSHCHVCLFVTLWTVARQATLSMGVSRQEYWSGLPCLPPGDLPIQRWNMSLTSPALTGKFFITRATWEAHFIFIFVFIFRASLVTQMVKILPTMQETWAWSLAWEDPLEKEKATHSSILSWRIPWTA